MKLDTKRLRAAATAFFAVVACGACFATPAMSRRQSERLAASRVQQAPAPSAAQEVSVSLDWNYVGHDVYVDGGLVGSIRQGGPTWLGFEVAPGTHVVEIVNPAWSPTRPQYGGGRRWEKTIFAAVGEIVYLDESNMVRVDPR